MLEMRKFSSCARARRRLTSSSSVVRQLWGEGTATSGAVLFAMRRRSSGLHGPSQSRVIKNYSPTIHRPGVSDSVQPQCIRHAQERSGGPEVWTLDPPGAADTLLQETLVVGTSIGT